MALQRFVALFDVHFGYERRGGHKVSLHAPEAVAATLKFIRDFQPHHTILGGDILDCGAVSHHNHGKPGMTEGLRLRSDAVECRKALIEPIEDATRNRLVYHIGNHEDWLSDLSDAQPALEGLVDVQAILKLGKRWEIIPQGEHSRIGKLLFIHGDQIKASTNPAKWAVEAYEKNIRLGHFHTFQTYTKTSAVADNGHTGTVVPCLCKQNPRYNEGAPNKWMQGFLYGWVADDGIFSDNVAVIVNGKFIALGKEYNGN